MSIQQTQAGITGLHASAALLDWQITPNFQQALSQAFPPLATAALYKPQSTLLDPQGKQIVETFLNRLNIRTPRNFDYDYAAIPASYYNVAAQTTALDKQVALELGSIIRNGAAMNRSDGVHSYAQPEIIKRSAYNDGVSENEMRLIISRQEVAHENLIAYNALQTDEKKKIKPEDNEKVTEAVTFASNPAYATYYALMTAMEDDLMRKFTTAKKTNPFLPSPLVNAQMPENYGGIVTMGRDVEAKTLQQLHMSDGSGKSRDQQFLDAMERIMSQSPGMTNRQRYQDFLSKLAQDAGKNVQEVEQILIAHYAALLDQAVRDAARTT